MQAELRATAQRGPFRIPLWLGFCAFLAIALFFLWEEHSAHIFGALPYVLLALCPIIHAFMHRGHGGHRATHSGHMGQPPHSPGEEESP